MAAPTASREIDAIIAGIAGWRGATLARLRQVITGAGSEIVEEVKWKKPSNPAGVPVWSRDGILCVGEALKMAVRLTFPKGALIADPRRLFNARLDSSKTRAVDFFEGEDIDEAAVAALIQEAVRLNRAR